MATIHDSIDDDLCLDDDIIHDQSAFQKSISTFSFEHIEAKHQSGADFTRSPSNLGMFFNLIRL
jgi:hypothetical protein